MDALTAPNRLAKKPLQSRSDFGYVLLVSVRVCSLMNINTYCATISAVVQGERDRIETMSAMLNYGHILLELKRAKEGEFLLRETLNMTVRCDAHAGIGYSVCLGGMAFCGC